MIKKKKYLKSIIGWVSFLISVNLFISPVFAFNAFSGYNTLTQDAYEYAEISALISSYYVGGEVTSESLRDAAIKGIFKELDGYSEYMTKEEYKAFKDSMASNYVGIGIVVNPSSEGYLFISEVMDGSPASEAGLLGGDIIYEVSGVSIKNMELSAAIDMISGEAGTYVDITVKRLNANITFTIKREVIHRSNVASKNIEDVLLSAKGKDNSKIRYIILTQFDDGSSEDFEKYVEEAKSNSVSHMILDLRGNPGGSLEEALKICDMIVPKGPVIHMIDKTNSKTTYSSSLESEVPFKIVILTDNGSASASELLTSAVKESKAGISVGTTTYGKGVAQATFELEGERAVKLTIYEYLTRNGNKVHNIGITPDYAVDVPYYYIVENATEKEDIQKLNHILSFIGYDVDIDEMHSEKNVKAIKEVQKMIEVQETGVYDLDTCIYLNRQLYKKNMENDIILEKAYELIINKTY